MEATVTSFVKARPWLGKRRCSFAQSDNASNYRGPTIEVDCGQLGSRCFSVAGMGKDEGDGNGAVNKRQLLDLVVDTEGGDCRRREIARGEGCSAGSGGSRSRRG